jgi:acrylyl-CoA reductase (NADPH)
MSEAFRALVVRQEGDPRVERLPAGELPPGDVLIRVEWSSLNYKDALAVTGRGKVIRSFPMIPGIDVAGTVVESSSTEFIHGDKVFATGWGLGERHWGGYSELARVPAAWLHRLPYGLDQRSTMALGTGGLTAMLCMMALEAHGVAPGDRPIVVTGATGGVGSIAVYLLARSGYGVCAATGRLSNQEWLRELGASEVIDRRELTPEQPKPLESERWAGGIDVAGGDTLAGILRSTAYGGAVAACGLAGGTDVPTTVFPFILRGVSLLGVDSVLCPRPRREEAWRRLSAMIDPAQLAQWSHEVDLEQVPAVAEQLLDGRSTGRAVVRIG